MTFSKMLSLAASIAVFAAGEAANFDSEVASALDAEPGCEAVHLLQARSAKDSQDGVLQVLSDQAAAIRLLTETNADLVAGDDGDDNEEPLPFQNDSQDALLQVLSDQDPCSSGLLGSMASTPAAKGCINQCQQSCPALSSALTAYFAKGGDGEAAVRESICQNGGSISCLVEPAHIGLCMPLITMAQGLGFSLPTTPEAFTASCKPAVLLQARSAKENSLSTPCTSGMLGSVASTPAAKACIDQCQGSCPALNDALTAYFTKGGEAPAKKSICQNEGSISCFTEPAHIAKCMPMISMAKGMGFSLPTSPAAFKSSCR